MKSTTAVVGLVLLSSVLVGCACTRGSTKMDTLHGSMLENRVAALETSQAEMRDEVRTLTGLQQGLRQQLDALTQQMDSQRKTTHDEK